MESKDQNRLRMILDCAPESNVRMYELADMLNQDFVHCYLNETAVLFVSWATMLWADKEEDLIPLFKYIPTYEPGRELFCIENRFRPLLEKHVAPVTVQDECDIWTLNELQEVAPTLESLTLDDASFVDNHWEFRFDRSLEFIQNCIQTMPTSCIRDQNGQPIAMAFCYGQSPYHINMGGFKVLSEHRKQGLGKKVHLDMCHKVLARNRKPLVHIRTDNVVSQHISQSSGFKRGERVFWGKLSSRQ